MRTPVALALLAVVACRSGPKAETDSMGAEAAPAAAPAELSAEDVAAIRAADEALARPPPRGTRPRSPRSTPAMPS